MAARFGPNAIALHRYGAVDSRVRDNHRVNFAASKASVGDALDDILSYLEGPIITEIHGYLYEVQQAGVPVPTRVLRRVFGIGASAAKRAREYARRLGISVEVLLASQRFTARRAAELQTALPARSRGFVTMAVGSARTDSEGSVLSSVRASPKAYCGRPSPASCAEAAPLSPRDTPVTRRSR